MRYLNCRIADDGTLEWRLDPPSGETYETCFVPLSSFCPAYEETFIPLVSRNPDMPRDVAVNIALDRLWERREELQRKGEAVSMVDAQETQRVPCPSSEQLRAARERLEAERREIVDRLATDDFGGMLHTPASLASTLSDLHDGIFALDDMIDEREAQL